MPDDFRETITAALLGPIRDRIIQGAAAGLDQGAEQIQSEALSRAHAVIQGQTHATFAGIVAYVVGAGVESGGVLSQAVSEVRDHNPDHVLVQTVESIGDDEIAVILTVPTDYIDLLEFDKGGARAFLGASMDAQAGALTDAAAQGIARALG